ncbi:MAG: hypothetical protein PHV85_04780 [Desulfovibrionaceae bacterium]|nr:hypothetical protein [Desulfovibrionaceae bacterium]
MADHRQTSKPGGTLRALAWPALAVLGFLVGLLLFTPWAKVWGDYLRRADQNMPSLALDWESIDRAGPLSFRLLNLSIALGRNRMPLNIRSAEVRLGLSPLADIRIDTGPDLHVLAFGDKAVELKGELNLASVTGCGDMAGNLKIKGKAELPEWGEFPDRGWLELRAGEMTLARSLVCKGFELLVQFEGDRLAVKTLSLREPVEIMAQGRLDVDRELFCRSSYLISGDMTVAGVRTPFSQSGRLEAFLGSGW